MPTILNAQTINAICYFAVALVIGVPCIIAGVYKLLS